MRHIHRPRTTLSGLADVHVHTSHSDGQPSVRDVLAFASNYTSLDVIAITDHDTIEGALEAVSLAATYRIQVIVGEEITSRQGHILGLFLHERVPPALSAEETVDAIHDQGALAIAAHPFLWGRSRLRDGDRVRRGVGTALRGIPFDGVEIHNSFPTLAWANRRAHRFNARHCRLPELGNSDAHVKEAIGKSFTRFAGHSALDFAASVRAGTTDAGTTLYGPTQVSAYFKFWRNAQRRA